MKTFTISFLALFLLLLSMPEASLSADYPQTTIKNSQLHVQLYLPDAEKGYYRGTRFEWSGIVQQIEYRGHTFFGDWKHSHDPTNHDDVNAIASEFGFDSPIGFEEADLRDTFMKIGIGELVKMSRTYKFSGKFPIKTAFAWDVKQGADWIEFHQTVEDFKGWGYNYTKRIELHPSKPVMEVKHVFKNTGTKKIETDYYCHNFTIIDEDPIDENYRLEFPFEVETSNNMKGYAKTAGDTIQFTKKMTGSFHTFLSGWENAQNPNQVIITNLKSGAGIKIQGTDKPHKFAFWTTVLATCPEAFIPIDLQPDETEEWTDKYTFFVTSSTKNN